MILLLGGGKSAMGDIELPLPRVRVHLVGFTRIADWSRAHPVRAHWRLYWNREAGASVIHAGKRHAQTPDRVVLIPPETPVARELERPAWSFHLHFSAGQPYDRLAGEVFGLRPTAPLRSRIDSVVSGLRGSGAIRASDYGRCLELNALVSEALVMIPDDRWPGRGIDGRIWKAIRFMEEGLAGPASNGKLAAVAHMSVSAFIRLFKRQVGEPPQSFWQGLRLQNASILLHRPELSVERVAEECGLCDRYYLSRLFKRRYGLGPAAYRKSLFREARID